MKIHIIVNIWQFIPFNNIGINKHLYHLLYIILLLYINKWICRDYEISVINNYIIKYFHYSRSKLSLSCIKQHLYHVSYII